MPRNTPSSKGSERQQPSPQQDRAADDQRESQTSSAASGSAPGATSLDTGDPAVQTPPAGQPLRPEESSSVETIRVDAPPDADRRDVRESPKPPASARQTQPKREPDSRHDESSNEEPPRGGTAPRKDGASQPSFAANWKTLLLIAVVALVSGAAGAWAMHEFIAPSQKESDQKSAKQASSKKGETSGSSKSGGNEKSGGKKQGGSDQTGEQSAGALAADIPGFTAADDAETLKKQIKHLADRIEQMDRRIDSLQRPKTETPPVVHTLQVQFADLAKEVDKVAEVPAELRRIEHRLSSVEQQLKTLRDAESIDGTTFIEPASDSRSRNNSVKSPAGSVHKERMQEDSSTTASSNADGGAAGDAEDSDITMDLGIELFQKERYAQARDVFRRLQRARPNDARVWYYSALANGLVTHVWDGKTKELLDKGVERERADDPSSDRIDAAFAALKSPEVRQWLERYRRLAKNESGAERNHNQAEKRGPTPESFKVP